jgi:hypothetical protein
MAEPSAESMKFKFPEFQNIPDATIEFALEEAKLACGAFGTGYWINNANQTVAVMYLAGHILQLSIQRAQSGTGQVIASESTPELSVTYAVPQQPDLSKPLNYTTTFYGIKFLELAEKNFPPVLVANTGIAM